MKQQQQNFVRGYTPRKFFYVALDGKELRVYAQTIDLRDPVFCAV